MESIGQMNRSMQHNNSNRRPFQEISENAVFLTGLPRDEDRENLYLWAKRFGWVKKFDLPGGGNGYLNKGFAYLHFRNKKEAKALINRKTVSYNGKPITVEPYTNRRDDVFSSGPSMRPSQAASPMPWANLVKGEYDSDCPSGYASGNPTQAVNTRCGSPNNGANVFNTPPLSTRRACAPAPLKIEESNVMVNNPDLQTPTPAQITQAISDLDTQQRVQKPMNYVQPQVQQPMEQQVQRNIEISQTAVDIHSHLYDNLLKEILLYNAKTGLNIWATPALVDSYFNQCFSLMQPKQAIL